MERTLGREKNVRNIKIDFNGVLSERTIMSASLAINIGILLHGAWDFTCRIACNNQYRF